MSHTFSPSDLRKLYSNIMEESQNGPEGFEGWYIVTDTDSGEFDAEKGAMFDYDIKLYDQDGNHKGSAIGGYYTGCTGELFHSSLKFVEPDPPTESDKLNDFLKKVVNVNDYDEKIQMLKNHLQDV